MSEPIDVDAILASLGDEFDDPGDDRWGGANLDVRPYGVGPVTVFCDRCGIQDTADYIGQTQEIRFQAARKVLARNKDWLILVDTDLCPTCTAKSVVPISLSSPLVTGLACHEDIEEGR